MPRHKSTDLIWVLDCGMIYAHINPCRYSIPLRVCGMNENQPDLTRNTTSRIVIRALNRETYQALRDIQTLYSKPVRFVLPGATTKISYGIVQHLPVMVPATLLKTTTGVIEATRMTVWDASTKLDWRQCGNSLALCYFAVVMELTDLCG